MKLVDIAYGEWLAPRLSRNLRIIEGHFMGSIVTDSESASDVDVLLLLDNKNYRECKAAADFLRELYRQFYATFGIRLHVTAFSLMEQEEYEMFDENAKQLTKLSELVLGVS